MSLEGGREGEREGGRSVGGEGGRRDEGRDDCYTYSNKYVQKRIQGHHTI